MEAMEGTLTLSGKSLFRELIFVKKQPQIDLILITATIRRSGARIFHGSRFDSPIIR